MEETTKKVIKNERLWGERMKMKKSILILMIIMISMITLVSAFPTDNIVDYWFTNTSTTGNYVGFYDNLNLTGNAPIKTFNNTNFIVTNLTNTPANNSLLNISIFPNTPFTISFFVNNSLRDLSLTALDDSYTSGWEISPSTTTMYVCNFDDFYNDYNCYSYTTPVDFTIQNTANHHITIVAQSLQNVSLYFDGIKANKTLTEEIGIVTENNTNQTTWAFASDRGNNILATPFSESRLRNIGYWNTALTDSQVNNLFNEQDNPPSLCVELWVANFTPSTCDGYIDSQNKTYFDFNTCGTFASVPIDNGTSISCSTINETVNNGVNSFLNIFIGIIIVGIVIGLGVAFIPKDSEVFGKVLLFGMIGFGILILVLAFTLFNSLT